MPVFLEIPGYGLSNRIRTILAYDYIARRQKRGQLFVFWLNTSSCPEHYNNLFEAIPGVTLITNLNEFRKLRKANPRALYFKGQGQFHGLIKRVTGQNITGTVKPNGRDLQIYQEAYRRLKPLPDIWTKLQNFIQEYQIANRWGLHIRRTDHVNFIIRVRGRYDNDAHFEKIIKNNPQRLFYLSTDNLATQEKFLKQFPAQLVVYSPIPDVNSTRKTSIEHAVIDLFVLGHCQQVHGSFGSSFSEFAYRLWNVYGRNQSSKTVTPILDQAKEPVTPSLDQAKEPVTPIQDQPNPPNPPKQIIRKKQKTHSKKHPKKHRHPQGVIYAPARRR